MVPGFAVPGELAPGIEVLPVRSATLAPATHTNVYLVGRGRMTVFDPASPWAEEQERLALHIEERISAGESLERIVLTHHHDDHVAGAESLRRRFSTERRIPIAAHAETEARLFGRIVVDEVLSENCVLDCGERRFLGLFTPGHAPGHLAFQDRESGALIAGDLVAGVGTILIDPDDGDLGLYLDSLERIKALEPSVLLPAHGPPLSTPVPFLSFYIAHRHQRTEQIRVALDRLGAASAAELAPLVYPELPPENHPVAEAQITSHLRWMSRHGLAVNEPSDVWRRAR